MKKMRIVWIGFVLALFLGPLIHSCSDDFLGSDYPWVKADKYTIATIQAVDEDETEFYFLLDGGQKLYPGDLSKISSAYKWINGQRAIIYFNLLSQKVPGYDYHAELVWINNILTKDIIPYTEETADSIGNDKITITNAWIGGKHVNINFQFPGTQNPAKLHMVNLVRNETEEAIEDQNYLVFELHHNAYEDYPQYVLNGRASFRLSITDEEYGKYKGIKIYDNSIYQGQKYVTLDFKSEESNQAENTSTEVHEVN